MSSAIMRSRIREFLCECRKICNMDGNGMLPLQQKETEEDTTLENHQDRNYVSFRMDEFCENYQELMPSILCPTLRESILEIIESLGQVCLRTEDRNPRAEDSDATTTASIVRIVCTKTVRLYSSLDTVHRVYVAVEAMVSVDKVLEALSRSSRPYAYDDCETEAQPRKRKRLHLSAKKLHMRCPADVTSETIIVPARVLPVERDPDTSSLNSLEIDTLCKAAQEEMRRVDPNTTTTIITAREAMAYVREYWLGWFLDVMNDGAPWPYVLWKGRADKPCPLYYRTAAELIGRHDTTQFLTSIECNMKELYKAVVEKEGVVSYDIIKEFGLVQTVARYSSSREDDSSRIPCYAPAVMPLVLTKMLHAKIASKSADDDREAEEEESSKGQKRRRKGDGPEVLANLGEHEETVESDDDDESMEQQQQQETVESDDDENGEQVDSADLPVGGGGASINTAQITRAAASVEATDDDDSLCSFRRSHLIIEDVHLSQNTEELDILQDWIQAWVEGRDGVRRAGLLERPLEEQKTILTNAETLGKKWANLLKRRYNSLEKLIIATAEGVAQLRIGLDNIRQDSRLVEKEALAKKKKSEQLRAVIRARFTDVLESVTQDTILCRGDTWAQKMALAVAEDDGENWLERMFTTDDDILQTVNSSSSDLSDCEIGDVRDSPGNSPPPQPGPPDALPLSQRSSQRVRLHRLANASRHSTFMKCIRHSRLHHKSTTPTPDAERDLDALMAREQQA